MRTLEILGAICAGLVFGLLLASVKFEVDNELVTFCSPMLFLVAINYTCLYLSEKRKTLSEKKPLKGFMTFLYYFLLLILIIGICGSLVVAGLSGSFLPLITGLTCSLALIAVYAYMDEKRKCAPLEKD